MLVPEQTRCERYLPVYTPWVRIYIIADPLNPDTRRHFSGNRMEGACNRRRYSRAVTRRRILYNCATRYRIELLRVPPNSQLRNE